MKSLFLPYAIPYLISTLTCHSNLVNQNLTEDVTPDDHYFAYGGMPTTRMRAYTLSD